MINCWISCNMENYGCEEYCFPIAIGRESKDAIWGHRWNAHKRTEKDIYRPCLYQTEKEFKIACSKWRLTGNG